VPWAGGRTIKYGVASLAALRRDLREWDALYLAGRMQKPVVTLTADARVEAAQRSNLAAALRAALLLLPERFSAGELRAALCALSYGGDVRVGLAEDAGKAARIAEGSAAALDALYAAPLAAAQGAWGALTRRGAGWEQDGAPAARAALVAALPAAVRRRLAPGGGPADAAAAAAAAPGGPAVAVRAALAATVAASSRRQAVAGLLSAGALRSARYLAHKLRRRWGAA
jgi:translocator assembly and maintenance protein 41